MSISDKDIQTVRDLAHKHLGHCQYAHGVYPTDIEFNKTILNDATVLPENLSMRQVEWLFLGVPKKPTDAYIKKFRGEAILYCMGASMNAARTKTEFTMPTIGFIAKRLAEKWAA